MIGSAKKIDQSTACGGRRLVQTAVLALAVVLAAGCVTRSQKRGKGDTLNSRRGSEPSPLSMTEVTGAQPVQKKVRLRQAAPAADRPGKSRISASQIKRCEDAVQRLVPPVIGLGALLPPGSYVPTGGALDTMLTARPDDCSDKHRRGPVLKALAAAMNEHGGRIGVILPLTGPRASLAAFVLKGMRASFQEAGLDFDRLAILKDSAGDPRLAETRLAELVFRDRPALVIGGLEAAEADVLARRAGELLMPTIILSRDRTLAARSTYVFNVYPNEQRLAETLVEAGSRRSFKRYAVLRPAGGKSDGVAEHFRTAVAAAGGRIVHDLIYTPGDFDSMQGVARQLFKTEAAERIDEYRAAYRKARDRAKEERVPFDPRMVVLRPIVDFDAVFLPDDFRTARHFAKLFKFHMVDRLPMIGNHEWRSPALIEPFDEFLEGSFFADFIGSYAKLPAGISVPTLGSPYFVHPSSVVKADFQLIGYRVGLIARQTLQTQTARRRQIPAVLARLPRETSSDPVSPLGTGPAFSPDRQSVWPTFLFQVSKGTLLLDATNPSASVSYLQPARPSLASGH